MAKEDVTLPSVNSKTLTGEDVLKIKKLSVAKPYDSKTEGFAGKNFMQYAFGNTVFIVHEDDDFHDDYKKGNIKSIEVDVSQDDKGKILWSLNNYISWTRANGLKRNQAMHDAITPEMFKVSTVEAYEELA